MTTTRSALLTEVNFRRIPPPRFPEDEMASEPWYSVGPMDVFPEEFPPFPVRRYQASASCSVNCTAISTDADYWKGLQEAIRAGKVIDVFPYRRTVGTAD